MTPKEIENLLRLHGVKPSHHRMRVYQYLVENRNHPSVEVIYQELIQEIPTLSRTTLYNTLKLFEEKRLVTLITIAENEMHYDADTSLHGHFRCQNCGQIYDIRLQPPETKMEGLAGFQVRESHIYFRGICPHCLAERVEP